MSVFHSSTKGNLSRRRRKQPANLLLDVVGEAVPTVNLSKSKRVDIVDLFKDLYHKYWANQQGDLVMVSAMNAAELTLTTLSYTQKLATMTKTAQKTSD